jgi:hypothetical protein
MKPFNLLGDGLVPLKDVAGPSSPSSIMQRDSKTIRPSCRSANASKYTFRLLENGKSIHVVSGWGYPLIDIGLARQALRPGYA